MVNDRIDVELLACVSVRTGWTGSEEQMTNQHPHKHRLRRRAVVSESWVGFHLRRCHVERAGASRDWSRRRRVLAAGHYAL